MYFANALTGKQCATEKCGINVLYQTYAFILYAQVRPSFGVTAMDILKFCAETNPAEHFEQQPSLLAEDKEDDGDRALGDNSAPADCFQRSALISASGPTNSAELSGGSPLLTPKQRLQLCANAYTAMGPINCTLSALYKGNSKMGVPLNTGTNSCTVRL